MPDHEIEERFRSGYEYFNKHFKEFDNVHLFDSSPYDSVPRHILTVSNNSIAVIDNYPVYPENLLSGLTELKDVFYKSND